MHELIPNIRFQIGKGPLHIIVDEAIERKEESDRSDCDTYLSGFRLAHLDENGNVIDGKVVVFEDENAPKIARLLAIVMWDIAKGTIGLPVELEDYSVTVDSPNNIDIRISRNNTEIMVPVRISLNLAKTCSHHRIYTLSTSHKTLAIFENPREMDRCTSPVSNGVIELQNRKITNDSFTLPEVFEASNPGGQHRFPFHSTVRVTSDHNHKPHSPYCFCC